MRPTRHLILVVDDDAGIRDLLTYALGAEGYDVLAVENGQIALERLVQHPPALILLDMNMPVMDGRDFLTAYAQLPAPHAPIIAFSASTRRIRIDARLAAPFRLQVITKPFDLDELYAAVRRALPSGLDSDRATECD
ncbi:MAG TPA: response regulator [Dehalococcoidia bacterium]|nr:response regulator [Dehalococcoidia bacterium]